MELRKSTALTFFSMVLFFKVFAQQNVFVKVYEAPQLLFVRNFELTKTFDKGYFVGNVGCWLKVDSVGNKQFMRRNGNIHPWSIDKTQDGGFIAAGLTGIVKLDSAANVMWAKEFLYSWSFAISVVRSTPDGGFIVGGGAQIASNTGVALLIKMNAAGNVEWNHSYRTTSSNSSFLILTPDNGYLLCGSSASLINSNIFHRDVTVMKIDSSGNSVWAKHYCKPGEGFDPKYMIATSDGNYVLSIGLGEQRIFKIDSLGNQLWMKEYLPQIPSVAQSVEETPDKGLIMGGYLVTFGGLIMKTDSAGNFLWANTLSGPNVFGGSVKPTADGGYIMATRASSANGDAIEIFKTDSLGQTGGCVDFVPAVTVTNVTDTVIDVVVTDSVLAITTTPLAITFTNVGNVYDICPTGLENVESDFELNLYPNPASNYITFEYTIKQDATMQITDLTGRVMGLNSLLREKNKETVDVSNFRTGLYFYSVSTNSGKNFSGKFVKD